MTDPRIENLAKILVHYSTRVKENDKVMIRGYPLDPEATPLIAEVFREVLKAGGHPHIAADIENIRYIFLTEASENQLLQPDIISKMVAEEYDVDIRIGCDTNTRSLTGVKPEVWKTRSRAYTEINELWSRRTASGELRWVVTRYPTHAYAQDAGMSVIEFSDIFYNSAFADSEDPLSQWKKMQADQERLVKALDGKRHVRIAGEGIDLEMSIADRKFISCHGRANIPDGEIFTGPVEDSVDGTVRFSYPCIWAGTEVGGVELVFKKGKVVKAGAEKNEGFLQEMLKTDDGAQSLGEFGIGTNNQIKRFTGNMLFDEKIGGTIHLALGNGYPESGSKNKSAIHWDMLCDMRKGGQIFIDETLVYDSGVFTI
ncbi:MAG: aminopeptidase [Anaerolineales bacterium]